MTYKLALVVSAVLRTPVRRPSPRLLPAALALLLATVFATPAQADDPPQCTAGSTAVSAYSGAGIVADCTTLLGLKDELRGTEPLNWSVDTAMADWHGVTVSGNRVTELDSDGKEFTGSIPSELAQLTSLTKLELFSLRTEGIGFLSGSIPPELGQLTNLVTLYLHNISVTGSIPPELGQLTNLVTLDLAWNDKLSGSIPPELGQLKNLETLDLSSGDRDVAKLGGSIPPELGGMTSLKKLDLKGIQLTGSIPRELGQLKNLEELALSYNRLTVCIPIALSEFKTTINPQRGDVNLSVCPNVAPVFSSANAISVAENAIAVVAVAATDADAADSITGYAITGGADQALFDIDAGTGALTFTSAPDFDAPADADTDNDYLVEVTATSGTSEREKTAVQTITVTVTDVDEPPSAPAMPTISSVTASGFTVTWTAPANTGPAITDYAVQYRVSGDRAWTNAGHSGTVTSVTVTGLTVGTAYEVRVRATNAEGTSAWSGTATATITTAPNAAPTFSSAASFTVAEDTATVGTVAATDADASDSITGYAISGGADRARFIITSAGALSFRTAPNYEAPTDANTDNAYAVDVTATSGTSPRALTATYTITVTVTDVDGEAPSAPSTPRISSVTATGFTVSWAAPANTGPAITDYDVQYRVSGDTAWTDAGHSGTARRLRLTGLTVDTAYEVQVRATNAEGTGAWSASATATPVPANAAPTFSTGNAFTVAEDTTAVGRVRATDADASDRITGYAISGGADRAKFTISSGGALSFRTAPDYEAPTDADTDNVYEVVVEATGGVGKRALSATQNITVTVTDRSDTPSAPAAPTISNVTASGFTVTWTAPANPGPAITDYDVQYRVSGDTAWTDARHSGTALSMTLTGLTAATVYEVRVRATNADGTGAWSATATATTAAVDTAAERIESVTETVQPEVMRAMVSGTLDVVMQRLERPEDGEPRVRVAGQSSLVDLVRSHEAELKGESEMDWMRALGASSFSLPLSEQELPGSGGEIEVWGRGAWRSLSGGSAKDVKWNGAVLSAHLGADWRPLPKLLAGMALAWHDGAMDYEAAEGAKGKSRNWMLSIHPYLGWAPGEDSSLWMSLGYGRGAVEVDDEEVTGEQSGISELWMIGAGGRARVLSSEGWLGGETSSLDVKGEGWISRTDVKGNGGMLADRAFDAQRVRVVLEGAHQRRLWSGPVLTPVLELGVRLDGGDGETGLGVETGGGLRFADATARLSSEVKVRGLVVHQGALGEWGVSGMLRYAFGAGGRGLSFSVTPSIGTPESGTARLWERGVDEASSAAANKATALRLGSELGYGLPLFGDAGVLTPYGRVAWSAEYARYRLGVRLERPPALSVGGAIERSETTTDADHRILLNGTLRW